MENVTVGATVMLYLESRVLQQKYAMASSSSKSLY